MNCPRISRFNQTDIFGVVNTMFENKQHIFMSYLKKIIAVYSKKASRWSKNISKFNISKKIYLLRTIYL